MTFTYKLRVFFEDTDAAGVVYYGNYLRFMERARSEWFLQRSIGMKSLMEHHHRVFVVSRTEIDYRRSAKLEDLLEVSVELIELKRVSAVFKQVIRCGDVLVCEGKTRVGCVDTVTLRPSPIPAVVYDELQHLLRTAQ
ncbi:acyl-CoA thioesterase [Limnobacter humi]|uniref:Acyl-CoA thioesterase n=1 Tax=Limnobacter humi TaxID=1778671 RepID=A0ABT1WH38_9BURK|nr:YbgC/FadM family acyl-CoA thioesterase [Limnobacter humi]MCQ8896837.1 acyl-CoA thioesterase [Limnobacter humi]